MYTVIQIYYFKYIKIYVLIIAITINLLYIIHMDMVLLN